MKSSTFAPLVVVAASQLLGVHAALKGKPSTTPVIDQLTSQGCYKSGGNLTQITKGVISSSVSTGYCGKVCTGLGYYVMGVHVDKCYCGYVYPSSDDITDDEDCNYPCPAYDIEACGSLKSGIYGVFNTGMEIEVGEYEEDAETTTAAATSTKVSSSTKAVADETTAVSATVEPTTTDAGQDEEDSGDEDSKSGPNIGAIVAGVVVGVVVVAAAIGGGVFFMRRRRNAEIEEEHRRNAAVNAFINGSKPPGSSGSISMTDSRMDPVMAHRRLSDGSIADNQDYSRRILRVSN